MLLPGRFLASHSTLFVVVVALFVTDLLISNVIAVKAINIFGYPLQAADLIFPITYILGDVLTEVYGYARARRAIWIGFGCNLFAVVRDQARPGPAGGSELDRPIAPMTRSWARSRASSPPPSPPISSASSSTPSSLPR